MRNKSLKGIYNKPLQKKGPQPAGLEAINKAYETTYEWEGNQKVFGPAHIDSITEMHSSNKDNPIFQENIKLDQYNRAGENIAYTYQQHTSSGMGKDRSSILETIPSGESIGTFNIYNPRGGRSRILSGNKAINKFNRITNRYGKRFERKTNT